MDRNPPPSAAPGSATMTITAQQTQQQAEAKPRILRLTLQNDSKPAIRWSEDTVDNEHMGKKSSKSKFASHTFVNLLLTSSGCDFRVLYLPQA